MPDLKTLCKDLEAIREAIDILAREVQALKMTQQMEGALNAQPSQKPQTVAAPKEQKPATPTPGDPAEIIPDHVLSLRDRKRKPSKGVMEDKIEALEDERKKTEWKNAVDRAFMELEFEDDNKRLERREPSGSERALSAQFKEIQDSVDKKIEEIKKESEDAAQRAIKAQREFESGMMDVMVQMFGIRFMRKVLPKQFDAILDLKSMANNIDFIDKKVQNGINQSIAEKQAKGLLSAAEANGAGGFMTTEAVAAQMAGGAWIGAYIIEHFPEILSKVRDTLGELEGISGLLGRGRSDFSVTSEFDKYVAQVKSIGAGAKAAGELYEAYALTDQRMDKDVLASFFAKERQIYEDNDRLNEAIRHYIAKKKIDSAPEFMDQLKYLWNSMVGF
jgi:uncharacterized protein (DUF4415 family)